MAEEKTKEMVPIDVAFRPLSKWWDIDSFFDESFLRPFTPFSRSLMSMRPSMMEDISPSVDIYEDNGDIVMKAELPGMKKEDIEVTLSEDSITLSGEKKKEEEVKKKNYYKWERSYGSFCRTFELPADVQSDKVKSTFKDGILEVRIPKSEEAKSKEIKVEIE